MSLDWTKLFDKYKGRWVALADDEVTVVSSGSTAKEALEQAIKQGNSRPILAKIPEKLEAYVGVKV